MPKFSERIGDVDAGWLGEVVIGVVVKSNPNHDERGRFAEASGGRYERVGSSHSFHNGRYKVGDFLYHATSSSSLQSIRNNGLRAVTPELGLSMADDAARASKYGPHLLRVRVENMPSGTDFGFYTGANVRGSAAVVPARYLEIKTDGKWEPLDGWRTRTTRVKSRRAK